MLVKIHCTFNKKNIEYYVFVEIALLNVRGELGGRKIKEENLYLHTIWVKEVRCDGL